MFRPITSKTRRSNVKSNSRMNNKRRLNVDVNVKEDPVANDLDTYLYQQARVIRFYGGNDYADGLVEEYKGLTAEQKAQKEKIYNGFFPARDKFLKDSNVRINRAMREAMDTVYNENLNTPVKVAVTGAAGQIGYALLTRIAAGAMFGPNTPVEISLLDIPASEDAMKGVVMELQDCAFPLVKNITYSTVAEEAFADVDYAMLVGAAPRGPGQERKDLLQLNGKIFVEQGKALASAAKSTTKVVVVGNPANTNAMIAANHASNIPLQNFAAMTKLDHNRGLSQLSSKIGCKTYDINNFVIWGNHSSTQFPDIFHATVDGKLVSDIVDNKWYTETFIPSVQKRGAAIIAARGLSSAASAASALCDNVREWHLGTNSKWTSVAVSSNGEYGVTPGLFYSYPIVYEGGKYEIVKDLPVTAASAKLMEATHQELLQEREDIKDLLK